MFVYMEAGNILHAFMSGNVHSEILSSVYYTINCVRLVFGETRWGVNWRRENLRSTGLMINCKLKIVKTEFFT